MTAEFETFAKLIEENGQQQAAEQTAPDYQRVTVLGGGNDGRLLAALALAQNLSVTLFSAYGVELRAIRQAGGITLRGAGPIGTFQIDQDSTPSIHTTAELDYAVSSADLIFITGPVHKHRTYAMVLAEHIKEGQTLVFVSARTFAAFESCALLKVGGCMADITVIEAQTPPYWVQSDGNALILSPCSATVAAAIPGGRIAHVEALGKIFPRIDSVSTVLQSSLSDAGGAVEAVALMLANSMAAGEKQLPDGAVALAKNQTLESLCESDRVLSVVDAALDERRQVAARFGVRNLPDTAAWINAFAGGRCISGSDEATTMLRNAVSGSLIPLQSAGRMTGVKTPVTDSLITLAGALLGSDIATGGRRLESFNVTGADPDEVRRRMESLARGE